MFRIGHGFDVHTLVAGRKLILGGVEIPNSKGLLGHSDADILLHAITDALCGALVLGDIGTFFSDQDPKYKDIDSGVLLKTIYNKVLDLGYLISNIDSTIIIEEPKLRPYIDLMRENIARFLNLSLSQISIKAKTYEKVGLVGEGLTAEAHAVILIMK